jgi:hypothetical protein
MIGMPKLIDTLCCIDLSAMGGLFIGLVSVLSTLSLVDIEVGLVDIEVGLVDIRDG